MFCRTPVEEHWHRCCFILWSWLKFYGFSRKTAFVFVLTGTGHGFAYVTATSQVSLYFSTHRPLATGLMLGGSSMFSILFPYLNTYLLEHYGWRNSFWILSGISLNVCVVAALIRPIENVSKSGKTDAGPTKRQIGLFFSKYWLVFCMLFINVLFALGAMVPNVYLVPYARSLGYSENESAVLLSFMSIGDLICRPLCGVILARFKILLNNILLFMCFIIVLLCITQLLVVFQVNYDLFKTYTLISGCLYGFFSTACITSVPTLVGTKNLDQMYGIFFFAGSFSFLASAPLAGNLLFLS